MTASRVVDKSLEDIYKQFMNVLGSRGNKRLEGEEKLYFLIFEYLWKEKLGDQSLVFESVGELNIYYRNFAENLDVYITDFFNLPTTKAEKKELPEEKKLLFLAIIRLYHHFAKIKFLLGKIQSIDLQGGFDSISYKFPYDDLNPVRQTIGLLNVLNEEIPVMLAGHYTFKKNKSEDELFIFISGLLSKLPNQNQLSEAIGALQRAVKRNNKQAIDEGKQTLNGYIIQIQETIKMVKQKIIDFHQNEDIFLRALKEESKSIKKRIKDIEQLDFFRALRILISDQEKENRQKIFKALSEACVKQSLQWIFNGPWEQTKKQLENIFEQFEKDYGFLIKKYSPDANKCICLLRSLESRRAQVEEVSKDLEAGLNKLLDVWQDSENTMTGIENILTGHLKTEDGLLPYCSSFALRHWWKLLLGGVGGGGGSGGISVLLALKGGPLAFFCVVGALVGTSLGAGSGLIADNFCADTKNNEQSLETDRLVSMPTKSWWSFSFWNKNINEKSIDENYESGFKLKPMGQM